MPGSVLTIGIPDPWKVLIYYLTLALALFLLYKEKQRKKYWRKQESFMSFQTDPLLVPGKRTFYIAAAVRALSEWNGDLYA